MAVGEFQLQHLLDFAASWILATGDAEHFHLPRLLDYAATWAWATSGAVVGLRKRLDFTGVFVLAVLSAMGGGLMRDAMLLQRLPTMITDSVYLPLVTMATLLVSLFARRLTYVIQNETIKKIVDLIDAVGIPAYAVIGMQLADERGIPIPGIVFVGMVNGVAGGLLRDVVVGEVPALLRPGQFSTLSLLLVCSVNILFERYFSLAPTSAAWITIVAFFCLRVAAVRLNWKTQAVLRDDSNDGK